MPEIIDRSFFPESLRGCNHIQKRRFAYKEWQFHMSGSLGGGTTNESALIVTYDGLNNPSAVLNDNGLDKYGVWSAVVKLMKNDINPVGGYQSYFVGNTLSTNQYFRVIDIPEQIKGKFIKHSSVTISSSTGSVVVTDERSSQSATVTRTTQRNPQDIHPNIGLMKHNQTTVGFILYKLGLIVITSVPFLNTNSNFGKNGTTLTFKGAKGIIENEIFVEVRPSTYTKTHNPTAKIGTRNLTVYYPIIIFPTGRVIQRKIEKGRLIFPRVNHDIYFKARHEHFDLTEIPDGTQIYIKDREDEDVSESNIVFYGTIDGHIATFDEQAKYPLRIKETREPIIQPFIGYLKLAADEDVFTEYPATFITTIGVYGLNEEGEKVLVGLAKSPHPIPIYKNVDLNFNIKFDQDE